VNKDRVCVMGYAVETAGTVEEACEKLPGDFDLILSDIPKLPLAPPTSTPPHVVG
jgi:hypothetical protein